MTSGLRHYDLQAGSWQQELACAFTLGLKCALHVVHKKALAHSIGSTSLIDCFKPAKYTPHVLRYFTLLLFFIKRFLGNFLVEMEAMKDGSNFFHFSKSSCSSNNFFFLPRIFFVQRIHSSLRGKEGKWSSVEK